MNSYLIRPKSTLFSATPHLDYYGGKVLTNPQIFSLYFGSYWNTKTGRSDSRYEDDFAKYLSTSTYNTVLSQYGVNKSSFIGSATVASPKNRGTITDSQIQHLIKQQIASGTAPLPDGKTVYTVFLPPRAVLKAPGNITSREGLGGYHSSFDYRNGQRAYYAAIVYSKDDNGIDFSGKARDNISITASHEWSEAATDPDVNNGTPGWYDERYGEIADIALNQGHGLEFSYGRIGKYAVQKLWSNKDKQNEVASR